MNIFNILFINHSFYSSVRTLSVQKYCNPETLAPVLDAEVWEYLVLRFVLSVAVDRKYNSAWCILRYTSSSSYLYNNLYFIFINIHVLCTGSNAFAWHQTLWNEPD